MTFSHLQYDRGLGITIGLWELEFGVRKDVYFYKGIVIM